jgi:hypothetical protein
VPYSDERVRNGARIARTQLSDLDGGVKELAKLVLGCSMVRVEVALKGAIREAKLKECQLVRKTATAPRQRSHLGADREKRVEG